LIIHSKQKQKDYYDTCLKFGIDTTLHYVRKEEEITLPFEQAGVPETIYSILNRSFWNELNPFVIGFCGKFYTGFEIEDSTTHKKFFIYSREELEKYLEDREEKNRYSKRYNRNQKMYLQFITENYQSDDIFVKVNAPIFKYEYRYSFWRCGSSEAKIKTNILLKDYHFYKVIDPFSAYQDIAQYLTNQLVKKEQISEFDDKLKIHAHGFDKRSFRHPIK
jgi:hypothetical protein